MTLTRPCILQAIDQTIRGDGDAARRELAAETDVGGDIRVVLAFTCWFDERDDEAAGWLRDIATDDDPLRAALHAAVLAAAGDFEEAERKCATADRLAQDPRSRMAARAARAILAYERGDRPAALGELRTLQIACIRSRDDLGAMWTEAWTARVLALGGRCSEARAMLDAVEERARAIGAGGIVALVERSRADDVMVRLRGQSDFSRFGTRDRAHLVESLALGLSGNVALAKARTMHVEPKDAFERVLVLLAQGDVEGARREAEAGDIEERLVEEILGVASCRGDLVLDGRIHELRDDDRRRTVSFRRSKNLRAMLYALARAPGEVVTKEELAGRLWPARYSPHVHDNALWVNVRRLRMALDGTRLVIASTIGGYTLRVPERFVYIPPNAYDDARRSTIPPAMVDLDQRRRDASS